jgi:hypothetical protein
MDEVPKKKGGLKYGMRKLTKHLRRLSGQHTGKQRLCLWNCRTPEGYTVLLLNHWIRKESADNLQN